MYVKMKIDALAWHARVLSLMNNNQVLDALTLFKKSMLPNDNPAVRNTYIKMVDHGSNAIVSIVAIIKAESLQEKMTLTTPDRRGGSQMSIALESAGVPMNDQTQNEDSNSNSVVQRRLYQLFSIAEPILLNDENVIKAINENFIELLSDMLIF
jgi:hypothetical protein